MGRPEVVGKVAERLLRQLAGGDWPPSTRLPSTRQLADKFGVDAKTAIFAVQRLAKLGVLEVRERRPVRVLPHAAQTARRLLNPPVKRPAVRRLAILFPGFFASVHSIATYAALIQALIVEAARRRIEATVVRWSTREQLAQAKGLAHQGYDAAVFVSFQPDYLASLFLLHEQKFPVMAYNRHIPGLPLPTVIVDLDTATRQIAARLHKLGHRNMCLVLHPEHYVENQRSEVASHGQASGWTGYLREAGLESSCIMPVYMPWVIGGEPYNRPFRMTLRHADRPTAIVFGNGSSAKAFLADPEFAQWRVPEELSLATFDTVADMPSVSWSPPLTNIEINHARTAQCIVETMLKQLAGDVRTPTIRVPMDINLTESIGPAAGRSKV